MATTDKNTIYSWFQTDDFPTEEQFRATWDSFWHKSESIPMSSISGLNQLFQQTATVAQLNDKANVDGSNIDVSAYQEKLNITNLIATAKEEVKTELLNGAPEAFDTLKEISDWISDDETAEGAILQAIQTEAAARTEADNLKLDKPTTTSTTTSYPFVVGEDGNGNPARLPAGDLGKNFFNSDLSNTTARNHTMNAGVTVNTLGNPHTLSGLPNKNADITNFRKVRVQNASGLDSVVDSKNLLTDGVTSMTDAEKDAWRLAQRKSTETYSVGQPRIDTILPPVVNSSNDYIQYVTLVGLNLFINNSNPSTAIVQLKRYKDINSNTVSETVIDITNYQVYQQNASILSFGINYSTLQTGYYKVEVTHNGVVNIGTSDLLVSNTVNTNTIILDSWEVYTPFEPSNLIITPTSIKKTYSSVIRGSTVIEQQVKHFIINASDVLSGFRLRFTYKLSPAGTELGNVKHRQSISFGLGYSKDVNTIIVPEILISFIRGTLNIGNASQPILFVPYIYDIDIVVKNGLATVIINLTNTGSIYTATFSFEQKNEQMFFYSTFLGSNPDNSSQIEGTTQELLFPTTYQSF